MNNAKQYISFFILLIYSIGVGHTFIEHSDFDIHCSAEQKGCCVKNDSKDHQSYNFINHSDLDLYDLLACLLGHINHSAVVDTKISTDNEMILKAPKVIREAIAFYILWSIPKTFTEVINHFVAEDSSLKPLLYITGSGKRGPPVLL
ncbi:hypothetical protein [Flammeovirga sp. EKP202]|uniref:hypothetical protein n=1 Tax=Flammeovirga sp. EKP202 TaxID=2770592 RepID=UPI00165FED18|nr:hypothetical protein [Flammeovirga sp. EKP202]MBD0402209.1 hypothetical protein [Flammeovirga sp. EKP202]